MIGADADPHRGQPVLVAGEHLEGAGAAMVLLHGRGASARDILEIAGEIVSPGVAYLAPQAAGGTWYPFSFLAPIQSNQPWLSSALASVAALLEKAAAAGIPSERTILLGFSQGGCLALEFAARHARRYGGVVGLSAGLIGPPGTPFSHAGSLSGTAVFLGSDQADPHVPASRIRETAGVLERLGGEVTIRLYERLGHAVSAEELEQVEAMQSLLTGG